MPNSDLLISANSLSQLSRRDHTMTGESMQFRLVIAGHSSGHRKGWARKLMKSSSSHSGHSKKSISYAAGTSLMRGSHGGHNGHGKTPVYRAMPYVTANRPRQREPIIDDIAARSTAVGPALVIRKK
jgi:hypothetical protein